MGLVSEGKRGKGAGGLDRLLTGTGLQCVVVGEQNARERGSSSVCGSQRGAEETTTRRDRLAYGHVAFARTSSS